MSKSSDSIQIKKDGETLFISAPTCYIPGPKIQSIEGLLENPQIKKASFHFEDNGEHKNKTIDTLCKMLLGFPDLDAKIFKRKNILFLQRPLYEETRLIRMPGIKILTSPSKFCYEGALFAPISRQSTVALETLLIDRPSVIQFSFPAKDYTETRHQFLNRIFATHTTLLRFLQEENTASVIQFFMYRHHKKELVDAYVRHENLALIQCTHTPPFGKITAPKVRRLSFKPLSKYQARLYRRILLDHDTPVNE